MTGNEHSIFQFDDSANHNNFSERTVILVCADPIRRAELNQMALASGCRVIGDHMRPFDLNRSSVLPPTDLMLIDLCSISERHIEAYSNIAGYLNLTSTETLVWTNMEGLDTAYATLPVEQCHFLVEANDLEAMLILTGKIRRGTMSKLHDKGRDQEFGALHRISDELADFARTLARIAEQDEGLSAKLNEMPVSFRPAPAGLYDTIGLPASPIIEEKQSVNAAYVRETIKIRRLRDRFFESSLFADPAWDILLDLYAARLEAKTVSVSSLCIAAAVPATTALRWIGSMTEAGLLERRHDPYDARRIFIELSDDAAEKLETYFVDAMKRRGSLVDVRPKLYSLNMPSTTVTHPPDSHALSPSSRQPTWPPRMLA